MPGLSVLFIGCLLCISVTQTLIIPIIIYRKILCTYTRAKQKLTICYAESRRVYTKEERHLPSRFITELPSECIQEIRLRGTVTRALNQAKVGSLSTSLPENEWKMGQKVKHEKFGFGTVINVEGSDNNTRLQIAFQAQGIKWLIAHLAKLEKVR